MLSARLAQFIALLLAFLVTAEASAQRRHALLIGNAGYAESPLRTPLNDLRAMSARLRELGFEIEEVPDADLDTMRRAVIRFGGRLARGDIAFFFYAGHGMQFEGRNYLVPVNARIASATHVPLAALDIDYLLLQLEEKQVGASIIVLDACRDNPQEARIRERVAGLARAQRLPPNVIIAYAASPGRVASDGDGINSPYMEALLGALRDASRSVADILTEAASSAYAKSGGRQLPVSESSLLVPLYLASQPPRSRPQEVAKPLDATPHRCDALAEPDFIVPKRGGGAGVAFNRIAIDEATAACTAAMIEAPHEARFVAYLGRVKFRAGARDEALQLAERAAAGGSAFGQHLLATMLYSQTGPKDVQRIAQLFRSAAQAGLAPSQVAIGRMHLNGEGVPIDENLTFQFFSQAAEQKYPDGLLWLGKLHLEGRGVTRNPEEAVRLISQAAATEHPEAMHYLGNFYLHGVGVRADRTRADYFISKAAWAGHSDAQVSVAVYFLKDTPDAVQWLRRAVAQNNRDGMYNLGVYYEFGRGGLQQSREEAIKLYRQAARLGQGNAWKRLETLGVPVKE